MKKKTKKKVAKKKKVKKVKKVNLQAIPKEMKPFVTNRYRTKDRSRKIVVVRDTGDSGYSVHSIGKGVVTKLRSFAIEGTELPVPVMKTAYRQLAAWWAGQVARTGMPSVKKEGSRRRRFLKKALAVFQQHLATRAVVQQMKSPPPPPKGPKQLAMVLPWICLYDPKQSCGPKDRSLRTTFRVHTAYCNKLDFERKKAIRDRGGDSWVIEAKNAEEAVKMQLAEFDAGDYGYDASDFTIHQCAQDRVLVKGKTTLGRVSNKRRA